MQIAEVQNAKAFQSPRKSGEFHRHVPDHRTECISDAPLVLPGKLHPSLQKF